MSSRGIGKRSLHAVLQQALMLVLLSWVSHVVGVFIVNSLYGGYGTGRLFIKALFKPIILGVGWSTYVPWFFTVLAIVRVLAWLFARNKFAFVAAWIILAGFIFMTNHLHRVNCYEWQNWPLSTLFFIIGMKLPKNLEVSRKWGLCALAGAVLLTWFNVPHFFSTRPCLICHLAFSANLPHGPKPDGSIGTLPVFLAQECLLFIFTLWAAQAPLAPIAGAARFFGRMSLQVLVLEGWWMATIDQYFWRHEPDRIGFPMLAGILVLTPCAHFLALKIFAPWLNNIVSACSQASQFLMSRRLWRAVSGLQYAWAKRA
jgi:hypothetical protein